MTRRDYILNTLANKLATQDNPDGTLKDDAPVRPADMTPEDAESISPVPPMSLRDRISKHLGTAQGYAAGNPTVSAAAGVGTLSALVAAVLSKKGKRLRNAGIAGVAGAAAGAGVGAAIGANRKRRAQQKAERQKAAALLEKKFSPEAQIPYSRQPTLASIIEYNRIRREKAEQEAAQQKAEEKRQVAEWAAQGAAQQPKAQDSYHREEEWSE